MTRLVVSLHDVAPSTAEISRRWLDLLETRSIRASLLVVPGFWQGSEMRSANSFSSWLRRAETNGHEIVLHGWEHRRGTHPRGVRERVGALVGRGCEEFWSVTYDEALARITNGLNVMRGEGFEPRGFVAPAWLMSHDTIRALRTSAMRYTVTHSRIIDLESRESLKILVTSQRPESALSGISALGSRGLASSLFGLSRPLRVAIHPKDILEPRLRRANLVLCDAALGHGYTTMTYGDLHHLEFRRPANYRS